MITHSNDEFLSKLGDDLLRPFDSFWTAARGEHAFPAQCDLSLVTVPRLAPYAFIIDQLDDGDFTYRFMGTQVDTLIGGRYTGKKVSETRQGRLLKELQEFFTTIIAHGVKGVMTTRLDGEASPLCLYYRVGYPVADDRKTPNKVIGLIYARSQLDVSDKDFSAFWSRTDEKGIVERAYTNV